MVAAARTEPLLGRKLAGELGLETAAGGSPELSTAASSSQRKLLWCIFDCDVSWLEQATACRAGGEGRLDKTSYGCRLTGAAHPAALACRAAREASLELHASLGMNVWTTGGPSRTNAFLKAA